MPTRDALIQHGREDLSTSSIIATVDIGWVSAASHAHIVDLAGLTDPEIARLAGGHTSKHIPETLLPRRNVDTLVLLRSSQRPSSSSDGGATTTRDDGGPFERAVEERIARDPWVQESFEISSVIRSGTLSYVVLRRRPEGTPARRRKEPPRAAPTSDTGSQNEAPFIPDP
ncbi:MAG: hypothetical protein U0165_17960 [Polyangiaceae bacterium]